MFNNQIITLMTIEQMRKLPKQVANCSEVSIEVRIDSLCNSLISRGYLMVNRRGEYRLTLKGWSAIQREIIILVADEDEGRVRARMKKMKQLYAVIRQEIDNFQKSRQQVSKSNSKTPLFGYEIDNTVKINKGGI